jgi:DNA-binding NarL/FixJ family response regulator
MEPVRVLVIDDDRDYVEAIVLLLQSRGYEANGCSDPSAVMDLAVSMQPNVVICDVSMPGMDGFAVLAAMRSTPEMSNVIFIFLTGRDAVGDVRMGMGLGADDYVSKKSDHEQILKAISARLERQALASSTRQAPRHAMATPPSPAQLQSLGLTQREVQVLLWVMQGKTNPEIAIILGLSPATVRTHLQNIFPKLGVETRHAAAWVAWRAALGETAAGMKEE